MRCVLRYAQHLRDGERWAARHSMQRERKSEIARGAMLVRALHQHLPLTHNSSNPRSRAHLQQLLLPQHVCRLRLPHRPQLRALQAAPLRPQRHPRGHARGHAAQRVLPGLGDAPRVKQLRVAAARDKGREGQGEGGTGGVGAQERKAHRVRGPGCCKEQHARCRGARDCMRTTMSASPLLATSGRRDPSPPIGS